MLTDLALLADIMRYPDVLRAGVGVALACALCVWLAHRLNG